LRIPMACLWVSTFLTDPCSPDSPALTIHAIHNRKFSVIYYRLWFFWLQDDLISLVSFWFFFYILHWFPPKHWVNIRVPCDLLSAAKWSNFSSDIIILEKLVYLVELSRDIGP
jgi:hypothetical protein